MSDFSWPKSKRIRNRPHYQKVQNKGRKFSTDHFLFFYMKSSQTQIGITVTKRVGNAVCRNKIKRFLREYLRHHYHEIPQYNIVVVARYRCKNLCKKEMFDSLNKFQRKISTKTK
jgi:ribonuclease P protein component